VLLLSYQERAAPHWMKLVMLSVAHVVGSSGRIECGRPGVDDARVFSIGARLPARDARLASSPPTLTLII